MREILFRAKRIDNSQWIYGGYFKHNNRQKCVFGDSDKPEDFDDLIFISGFADWNMPRPLQYAKVDPETVGQFTGLTDKNGTKIFEGDIIRRLDVIQVDRETGRVAFDEVCCCFYLTVNGGMGRRGIFRDAEYEIIGNIHDNPELLEVKMNNLSCENCELASVEINSTPTKTKIKTPLATIIVGGELEKPCYSILYLDPTDNIYHIGCSSYNLDYVRQWLEDDFEIIKEPIDLEKLVKDYLFSYFT